VNEPLQAVFKAAKFGDVATMRALLAADATLVAARDADASTPLHYAVWKGHLDLVELLLAAGADVNAQNQNDHWGTTPLHAAAHANQKAIAALLLAHGADLEARDGNGKTPLDHTAFHKANATAKLLREHALR
jgi:ankyrin repeat protein